MKLNWPTFCHYFCCQYFSCLPQKIDLLPFTSSVGHSHNTPNPHVSCRLFTLTEMFGLHLKLSILLSINSCKVIIYSLVYFWNYGKRQTSYPLRMRLEEENGGG